MSKFQVGDVVRVVNDYEFYFRNGEEELTPVPTYKVVDKLRYDWLVDQENLQVAIGWFDTIHTEDFELVDRAFTIETIRKVAAADRKYRVAKDAHDSNVAFCEEMLLSSEEILKTAESELNALKSEFNII